MKLIEKVRQGSKVKKRYDEQKTPYQRMIEKQAAGTDFRVAAKHGNTSHRRLDLRSIEGGVSQPEHGHGLSQPEHPDRAEIDQEDRFREHL